jgi:hypothetical protein
MRFVGNQDIEGHTWLFRIMHSILCHRVPPGHFYLVVISIFVRKETRNKVFDSDFFRVNVRLRCAVD